MPGLLKGRFIRVDVSQNIHPISPLIYGMNQAPKASDDFVAETLAAGSDVLMTLPTLGWVAKNNDSNTCSFPAPDGSCGDAEKASCDKLGAIADPNHANVHPILARSLVGSSICWSRKNMPCASSRWITS
jgi:hypothetical protein